MTVGVLSPGGVLAGAIPEYEDRPGQREMAAAVESAIANDHALMVEAGTGVGKTLAYLVPALQSGRRVVVSTGTRLLQEQIARHDVPLLHQILPHPFVTETLKGVSNYLCRRKLATLGSGTASSSDLQAIRTWADETGFGDRAELNTVADDSMAWEQVTVSAETRLGSNCPYFEKCFVTQARRRAEKANLILVNHHLFFSDLALRTTHEGARVLPEYDVVIFDEAHQLEEVITEHFGISVSTLRVSQLITGIRSGLGVDDGWLTEKEQRLAGGQHVVNLQDTSDAFFAAMRRKIVDSEGGSRAGLGERQLLAPSDFEGPVEQAWFALDDRLDALQNHAMLRAEELGAGCGDEQAVDQTGAEKAYLLGRRTKSLRDDLATLAEQTNEHHVYWGELTGRGVRLRGSPIEVQQIVRERLLPAAPTTVFTSASLTCGGSFDFFRKRLGLAGDIASELAVDSPFDYAEQAMLYLERELPDPSDPGFTAACCDRIAVLLAITGGRAFVLFTSHRALREASRVLKSNLPYRVLVQGEEPRSALIERFRREAPAVLLATGGFWEGVDVPGESLSMVIIDKLPFAPPADPLTAARLDRMKKNNVDPFEHYQLPQAALVLKQGVGRLIRRRDDRGIVAILDNRIVTRRYGRVFVESLPEGMQRTSTLERVRRWWRRDEPSKKDSRDEVRAVP